VAGGRTERGLDLTQIHGHFGGRKEIAILIRLKFEQYVSAY
jgi:hypothetical protein